MTDKKTTDTDATALMELVEEQAAAIEELKKQVEVLSAAVPGEEDDGKPKVKPGHLDFSKTFAKHRGSFGQVLEQDGKHFNLKGEPFKKKVRLV